MGYWPVHYPRMKPCKSADYYPCCVGYGAKFQLGKFYIIKKIFVLKNLTDFRKTVETGVDPRLFVIPLLKKLEASNQIIDVTAEWFKRWVGLLHVQTRDFAFKDAARHLL